MERDEIVSQKQQGHRDWRQDHSDSSSPQRRCSRYLCTEKAQWARWRNQNPGLGRVCPGDQDHIQQQDKDSRCWIEDRNLQARKEEHGRFHDQIWCIGHEGRHQWATCHLFIEEECMTKHYQNDTRIPTCYELKTLGLVNKKNLVLG